MVSFCVMIWRDYQFANVDVEKMVTCKQNAHCQARVKSISYSRPGSFSTDENCSNCRTLWGSTYLLSPYNVTLPPSQCRHQKPSSNDHFHELGGIIVWSFCKFNLTIIEPNSRLSCHTSCQSCPPVLRRMAERQ